MGYLRFRRRVRIAPGVTLNFGKKGVSTSVGVRGAHMTFGRRGVRSTVGIPGTGLSYTTTTNSPPRGPQVGTSSAAPTVPPPWPEVLLGAAGTSLVILLKITWALVLVAVWVLTMSLMVLAAVLKSASKTR
jgi:hypothetical protein